MLAIGSGSEVLSASTTLFDEQSTHIIALALTLGPYELNRLLRAGGTDGAFTWIGGEAAATGNAFGEVTVPSLFGRVCGRGASLFGGLDTAEVEGLDVIDPPELSVDS